MSTNPAADCPAELARRIAATATNPLIRLLDDPATLRAARDDPVEFIDHDSLLVVDEVQLAPELFRPSRSGSWTPRSP